MVCGPCGLANQRDGRERRAARLRESWEYRTCLGCGERFHYKPRGHRDEPGRGRYHNAECSKRATGRIAQQRRAEEFARKRWAAECDLPCPASSDTHKAENKTWVKSTLAAVHGRRASWIAYYQARGGRKCRVCGAATPMGAWGRPAQMTCVGKCADVWADHKLSVRRENNSNAKHRRRERGEPKADTVRERIVRRAIFDRDGWSCYLCRVALTPPSRTWAPTMATIDHVIPLARGGRHESANLRACCAQCNSAKSDRVVA